MIDLDTILWQSAQNIVRSQENLDKLFDAFGLIECRNIDLTIEEASADEAEGDFLQPVWNRYFFVKRNNRVNARIRGILTLAIQLTSDEGKEADWEHGKRAKVLIGYSPNPNMEYAWVFNTDSPNAAGYCEDCMAQARYWKFDEVGNSSWFYALLLNRLTSTTAVRNLIVAPVHEILRSGKVDEVLVKSEGELCLPPQS